MHLRDVQGLEGACSVDFLNLDLDVATRFALRGNQDVASNGALHVQVVLNGLETTRSHASNAKEKEKREKKAIRPKKEELLYTRQILLLRFISFSFLQTRPSVSVSLWEGYKALTRAASVSTSSRFVVYRSLSRA